MKFLVTGGSGLLGSKFTSLATTEHDVFAGYNTHKISGEKFFQLDITDKVITRKLVEKISPDVIIHTAAFTNVDLCETVKEIAWRVNVEGTKNVAEASKDLHSKLVYISTDYVFDGKKGLYKEKDTPNPINYYGKTKLEGERIVQQLCDDYIIARASTIYGWNPVKLNFVTWVINELKNGNKIKVAQNQFTSPTLADNLAEMNLKLIEQGKTGIFHTAGAERINRFEFAKEVARTFGLNESLIDAVPSHELDWIAKRPLDSSLNVSKISKITTPLNIDEGLERMRRTA